MAIWEKALGAEHPDVALSLNNLAVLYQNQGRTAEALERIRQASAILRRRLVAVADSRSAGAGGEIGTKKFTFHIHLGVIAARMGEDPSLRAMLTAESVEIGQLHHDGSIGAALAQMAARYAAGSGPLAELVRQRQDMLKAWQKADADLVATAGKPPAERQPTAEQTLRERVHTLGQQLDAIDRRLNQEFPAYAELTLPEPVALDRLQRLIHPEEAMLVFAVGKGKEAKKSYVWLIRPGSASVRELPFNQEALLPRVDTLRAALDPERNGAMSPFPVTEAYSLYRDLIGPEAAGLEGVKTLFIVADGALERLPFSVLVTEPPSVGAVVNYQKVAWLVRRWAPVTLPTVASLRALRSVAAASKADKPFIGFGNPNFTLPSSAPGATKPATKPARGTEKATVALTRSLIADANELRSALVPLPETADELRTIAGVLRAKPDSLYLGTRASVPVVRTTNLAAYRVVAFATHALVGGELRGIAEPAIALTPPRQSSPDDDGLLRASQVAQLKFDADWVLLSACNTAAGSDQEAGTPGLSGLAKTFFYAGARAMLVSHWSVLSDTTVLLTTGMLREWQSHPELGRAEALRRSEMALLDNPPNPQYSHPMAWAPFVVAGEGGIGLR
ncbi:hypothetical protein CCP3SC15_1460001 [Gammaproteobacteria bacterium]